MHADLAKLVDLQAKDNVLADVERRLASAREEVATLDAALRRARDGVEAARRALAESVRRREELETKIETQRTTQERRRQRLEQVRNSKEASAAMVELDLARSVMERDETEWLQSAEVVVQQERRLKDEEAKAAALEDAQAEVRARLDERLGALTAEHERAAGEREETAAQVDRALRIRYDRLRRTRTSAVVVPLIGGACGACHTSIPLNRRSQIRSGQVVDGCEACGAILYAPEALESA